MANPICLSPLKFYDSLAKQNHRKSYAYGHISPLVMPLNTIDPFQFVDTSKDTVLTYSDLTSGYYNLSGARVGELIEHDSWMCYMLSVSPNQKITLTTTGGNNGRAYAFTDINRNIVQVADAKVTLASKTLTVPSGCRYMFVNCAVSKSFSLIAKPAVVSVNLYNAEDKFIADITTTLIEGGLEVKTVSSYNIFIFNGIFPVSNIKYEGEYYIEIITSYSVSYYSEVFCFTNAINDCLTITYRNPEADFAIKNGIISFNNNFAFKLRLQTELGKPEYKFEEEATKRLGYSFIESQVSSKIYKFTAILPEYLCDALRLVRLCSNKTLESKGDTYDMITFDMDVDWQDQGDLASVKCEFQVDNILVNLGGYSSELLGGDFNKDYNADFKTD